MSHERVAPRMCEVGSLRTMSIRAWQVQQLGEPADVLTLVDAPSPEPGPGQVRVAVRASAVNFADTLLCRGEYQVRPEPPFVPGLEVCGDVLEVGTDVTHVAVGDRVLGATALPAAAFDPANMSDTEKAAFGQAVRDYLMANPDVLVESINVLEERRVAGHACMEQRLVADIGAVDEGVVVAEDRRDRREAQARPGRLRLERGPQALVAVDLQDEIGRAHV